MGELLDSLSSSRELTETETNSWHQEWYTRESDGRSRVYARGVDELLKVFGTWSLHKETMGGIKTLTELAQKLRDYGSPVIVYATECGRGKWSVCMSWKWTTSVGDWVWIVPTQGHDYQVEESELPSGPSNSPADPDPYYPDGSCFTPPCPGSDC